MTTATVATAAVVAERAEVPGRARHRGLKKLLGYAVLVAVAFVYLYPFVIQIATSFKSDAEASNNALGLIPNPLDMSAWRRTFGLTEDSSVPILRWLMNSVLVTVVVTASRVFLDSLAGYALSRLKFRGRGFLFATVLAVISVPGVALLVPKFLIVKSLGIYDSYAGMIMPLLIDAAGVFIMKQFFDSVSVSRRPPGWTVPASSAPSGQWSCRWRGLHSSP